MQEHVNLLSHLSRRIVPQASSTVQPPVTQSFDETQTGALANSSLGNLSSVAQSSVSVDVNEVNELR